MSVAPPSGQNRVMIYGPKNDGTYIVEFRKLTVTRWRLACPRVKPACLNISRPGCRTGYLYQMLSSHDQEDAPLQSTCTSIRLWPVSLFARRRHR